MVLTIMFVLIFILAGTIAVVYSAHNRAMIKYEGSQGYYGTRSIIDSYANTLLVDDTTNTGSGYYYLKEDKTTPTNDGTSTNALTQGRALELDLYSVKVDTSGDWYQKKVINEGKDASYVNPSLANDSYTQQYNIETTGDTITYKLSSSLDSWASGYGRLADPGTDITVEVKVLERILNMGTGANDTVKFKKGLREKDYFKIQVTSHLTYNGEEYTTVKILETKDETTTPSTSAVTSLAMIEPGANLNIYGGATSVYHDAVEWPNNTRVAGNIYFQSDVTVSNASPVLYFKKDDICFVRGTLKGKAPFATDSKQSANGDIYQEGTVFYAQTIDPDNGGSNDWGSPTKRINLVCEDFILNHESQLKIHANVYCENLYLEEDLSNVKDQKFDMTIYCNTLYVKDYAFDDGTGKLQLDYQDATTPLAAGNGNNIFSKGTDGRFTDSSTIYVTKNVMYNGVAYGLETGTLNADNAPVLDVTTYKDKELKLCFDDHATDVHGDGTTADYTLKDEAGMKVLKLPAGITFVGRTKTDELEILTPKGLYKDYFDDTTWNSKGDFDCDMTNTAALKAFIKTHIKMNPVPAYDSAKQGTAIALSSATDGETDTEVITHYNTLKTNSSLTGFKLVKSQPGDTFYKIQSNSYQKIVFDATYGDIYVYLEETGGSSRFSGKYACAGDNKVFFVFGTTPTATTLYEWDPVTSSMVMKTVRRVELGGASAGGGFDVFDVDYGCTAAEIASNVGVIDIDNPPTAPNIYYVVADGVTVDELFIDNNNKNEGPIQGYFTLLDTKVILYGDGHNVNVKYNNKYVHGSSGEGAVKVIGSIICNGFKGDSAKGAVVFVPNENGKEDKGKIMLKWQTIYNDDLIS